MNPGSFVNTELQDACGKWRAATYLLVESESEVRDGGAAWARVFATEVEKEIVQPLRKALFPRTASFELPEPCQESLANIGLAAYNWSFSTKTAYVEADFHAVILDDHPKTYHSHSARMQLDFPFEGVRHSEVVAFVGLGLQSTVSYGTARKLGVSWEEKMTVMIEKSFT